jgi:undecaprenyl diphosphate synthase
MIKDNLLENIVKNEMPRHVAIIMDGNGRWAKKRGNKRIEGHRNALQAVRNVVEVSGELKIEYLTLYAFSTENWNRPKVEVNALMTLFIQAVKDETENLIKNNVKMKAIGNIEELPENVKKNLNDIIKKTQNNSGLTLILALNYSSRQEITHTLINLSKSIKEGKIQSTQIDEKLISNSLQTSEFPDPDLLIRTGGEYRISNFLLWQISYTELYFTDILWPDFSKNDYYRAINDYQKRERRFGKTSEQLKK